MKSLTLIKLGGSIITNKEIPMRARQAVIRRLLQEISDVREESSEQFIIGHGQGSFAHAPALRYKTMDGFIAPDSLIGMAITTDAAAQLNRIVVGEAVNLELPAVSYAMSQTIVTAARVEHSWTPDVLLALLEHELLPITYGDVLVDSTQGCTIWSTEVILNFLATQLRQQDYVIKKIVHVGEVAGVLDGSDKVIEAITPDIAAEVKSLIYSTKGFDVTGGMWHKIEESLKQAEQGIDSYIIDGTKTGNLAACLRGEAYIGTRISASA